MADTDVLVIGAGLAGLTCARHLHRSGIACKVIEAADGVGGRVRTDVVGGYRLDRGFQVLLTAYPELQREADYAALNLGTFHSGAEVRGDDGRFHRVADPLRHPADGLRTLAAPVGTLADKLRVLRLWASVRAASPEALLQRDEFTTEEALRYRWNFSDRMIEPFFRPLFGGILLDRQLRASSRMFEFVFKMFAEGYAALPATGMEALPQQLAAALPDPMIRLNTRVGSVKGRTVVLSDGEHLEAEHAVVVATEAPEANRLVGGIQPTMARQNTTLYYSAASAPNEAPILVLNGTGAGPINTVAPLSNVAPSYAPPGRALLSVSVVGMPPESDAVLERAVRRQLRDWYGSRVEAWEHLRTYRIRYALPEQAPPYFTPDRRLRLHDGLYACGDHRRTASLNGAVASGREVARAVAHDLHG